MINYDDEALINVGCGSAELAELIGSVGVRGAAPPVGVLAWRDLTSCMSARMLIYMRTTLVIDDELLRQVKRKAAERNTTISDIVNDALRQCLEPPAPAVAPFSLVTYGRSDESVRHDPSEFAAALEDEDQERIRS